MTKNLWKPLIPAALALVAAACGSNGSSLTTNLKPVFFRTMGNAPVATFTLLRANGSPISGGGVVVDTHQTFGGWLRVGLNVTANANASGVASVALPAATYPIVVEPGGTTNVGTLNDSLSVNGDTARTYQTSQQTWTITSTKAMSSVELMIYQVDGNGRATTGPKNAPTNPQVLDVVQAVPGGTPTTVTFNTELFKGSYRAVIFATPVTSTDVIAPFETASFTAAGGGANEPHPVTMSSSGNVVSISLIDAAGSTPVPDADIGGIAVFDADTLISLVPGLQGTTGGAATIQTGAVSNVVLLVGNPDGSVVIGQKVTANAGTPYQFKRYVVSGHAKPATGSIVPAGTVYGTVAAQIRTTLGSDWDTYTQGAIAARITDALGTYQLKLFAGSYDVKAVGVPALANSSTASITVSAAATQDFALSAGGVFAGNVQDTAHNNQTGVNVTVYDSNHNYVTSGATDAGGNYSLAVPFGTYDLLVGGALQAGQTVNASAPTKTTNLTAFQITGRLVDAASSPVAGRIYSGGNSTTASPLGTYTINAVQGVNWFLFAPPSSSPSLGFAYETAVQIDANTIKSLP